MKSNCVGALGWIALLSGIALLGAGTPAASERISPTEARTLFGGCMRCKTVAACGVTAACQASVDNPGKFNKQTSTNQAYAACTDDRATGPKTCTEDTPMDCTTTTVCNDNACSVNCSSTTTKVKTNCTFGSDSCVGS